MNSTAQPFLVIKGYHMGSAWFEEAFNKLPGCSFFFEYEHCLRDCRAEDSHLAPATLTASFLRESCGSCSGTSRATRCRACDRIPPPSGATRSCSYAQVDPAPPLGPCRAAGLSFAATGPPYFQHISELQRLMPRLPVLVHVRSNFVKHSLSYLRQSCPGELNHATKHKERSALHVSPSKLLFRARTVALAQLDIIKTASKLAGGAPAYRIVYEALQADLPGELRRVLLAVGVSLPDRPPSPPPPASAPSAPPGATRGAQPMVKAGFDDLRSAIANFDQLDTALHGMRCVHEMLHEKTPRVFNIERCAAITIELQGLGRAVAARVVEAKRTNASTGKMYKELSPDNCAGRPDAGGEEKLDTDILTATARPRRRRLSEASGRPACPNATHCLLGRLQTRLARAQLPAGWLDPLLGGSRPRRGAGTPPTVSTGAVAGSSRPTPSQLLSPPSIVAPRELPPPPPPSPPPAQLSPSPPPPETAAAGDGEPCTSSASGELRRAMRLEAARSRELLTRLETQRMCDGVGEGCRPLGEATPASPVACPLPGSCRPAAGAAGVAAAAPRVYVYGCMDELHARLLSAPHVREFFDANLPRNQFISDVALHRALLASPFRTLEPRRAHFFFVPFYSRLAYPDRKASGAQRAFRDNATATLSRCLRASRWWRRSGGKDHLAVVSSTRDPERLFGAAWPPLRKAILLRIEASDRRFGERGVLRRHDQLVLPYYVPMFAEDHAVAPAAKRHSVCFFGSDTNGLRRRAIKALRGVPHAQLRLSDAAETSFGGGAAGGGSKAARKAGRRQAERRRVVASRGALRECKLCLVPAGITPSSRRFYEALAAQCVPLLLADDFEPAFTAVLPLEGYAVRAAQAHPEALPQVVGRALERWDSLVGGVRAARTAFALGLGTRAAAAPQCDALHAVMAELGLRFRHRMAVAQH